jgi:hypothetical protein
MVGTSIPRFSNKAKTTYRITRALQCSVKLGKDEEHIIVHKWTNLPGTHTPKKGEPDLVGNYALNDAQAELMKITGESHETIAQWLEDLETEWNRKPTVPLKINGRAGTPGK